MSVGNTRVELLLSHGALIDCQESWGQTPPAITTLQGRLVTMRSLLHHRANPGSYTVSVRGEALMQEQICFASPENEQVSPPPPIEIRDYRHGQTPLHIACSSKDEERVLVLLDAGCDVQATDGQGRSPLGVALLNRFYGAVPLLWHN